MNYEILISFIGASMLLTIMPGPDILYVLVQSISNGKKSGIATSLGLVLGIIIHTTLVALGVSALIKQYENIYFTIKLFGAFYLLYLAFAAYQSKEDLIIKGQVKKSSLLKLFKRGFIMNVLNPKVSIFFLAFFPGFLYSSTQSLVVQFYVLGFIFMVQAFLIFSMVSVLSGSFSSYLQEKPKLDSNIKYFKIIVLIGIAFFILFS